MELEKDFPRCRLRQAELLQLNNWCVVSPLRLPSLRLISVWPGSPPAVAPVPELRSPPPRAAVPETVISAAASAASEEAGIEAGLGVKPEEEEVKVEPSGARSAGSRRSKKLKPPPADVVAQRAVKAKGTIPKGAAASESKAGSSGDAPTPQPMETRVEAVTTSEDILEGREPTAAPAGAMEVEPTTAAPADVPMPPADVTVTPEEPEVLVASSPLPRMVENHHSSETPAGLANPGRSHAPLYARATDVCWIGA